MRRGNEALREVLSEGIGALKDPRIGFVTVTGVSTSRDLRQATVHVSVPYVTFLRHFLDQMSRTFWGLPARRLGIGLP